MSGQTGNPDPFFRAYGAIREDLARAKRPPGSQIRVDETARQLGISPTPVREALAMLAGERLVHRCRRQGYFAPKPSASDLIELYTLSEMHLLTAIRLQSAKRQIGVSDAFEAAAKIEDGCGIARVFIALLARAEIPCLLDHGALLIERLAPARLAEDPGFADRERDELAMLLHERRMAQLTKTVRSYHRVRRSNAAEIAKVIAAASAPSGRYIPDMV